MKFQVKSQTRTLSLLVAAFFTMAFTLPGCPDTDALNQRLEVLEKKEADNTKQLREIADNMRTMNDEHNTMKQLVSQVSTTVLEQKEALEKIDSAMKSKHAAPAAKAAPKGKPAGKKRH